LTVAAEVVHNEGFNHMLWLNAVPLKVNIFIWRLFMNRLATKDNLFTRHILVNDYTFYSANCGFVKRNFYKLLF